MHPKKLNKAVLIFGMIQLALSFSGSLASGAERPRPSFPKVRIPRLLLSQPIHGSITIQSDSDDYTESTQESLVYWEEYPTELPDPQPAALGDYRDFKGCAAFKDLNGVAVCFNVMPDVSSVGVNAKEMQLQGLQGAIQAKLDQTKSECDAATVKEVKFTHATRENSLYRIYFQADTSHPDFCQVSDSQITGNVALKL